jgi:hypothetical protein
MAAMVDEIFDRGYQAARTQLNGDLGRAFRSFGRTVGDSLRLLHRIEWSAPWTPPKKPTRRA